jgi:hypothetical protein
MKIKNFFLKYIPELIVLTIGTLFGIFLMFSTFSKKDGFLLISTKAWSDFASHIPLIRSFSLGLNFPPEYPLFPGEAIKYHFGFYFGIGLLEKIGIPIDLALNIPSVIGFILLTFVIYVFAKLIFKSKSVGILASLFFIFNSSLSYIYYFRNNPISLESIMNIPLINNFQSFAPYGDGIISAFWNLNIYTNQRHLALSFFISLFILYFFINPVFKNKKINYKISILLGIILGASFFLHLAVLLMTGLTIFFLGLLNTKIRKSAFVILFIMALLSFPQYLYLSSSGGYNLNFNPGYLIANDLTIINFIKFWTYNLGISIILIPFGFIFSNTKQRKIFISIIPIFIVGNLFQFSPEIAANHKFFNYFILISNMFSAYALFILWNKKYFLKPIVAIMLFLMLFGGIIDFFPLFNDHKVSIPDYELKKESMWIINNTSPDSIFLSNNYLYDPASLAGRKVFLGWPYFAWSQGYDTETRAKILKDILESKNEKQACEKLLNNNIHFVEIFIEKRPNPDVPQVSEMWNNKFKASYKNLNSNYSIYDVGKNCN